jgi:hypothetical protein
MNYTARKNLKTHHPLSSLSANDSACTGKAGKIPWLDSEDFESAIYR